MGPDKQELVGLKDIHKECLRLAGRHYSSKEIGRMLGISKHTVDQRLRHAMVLMGASSRFEAARRFCDWEDAQGEPKIYDPILYDTPHIPSAATTASDNASAAFRDRPAGAEQSVLREAQAPYVFANPSSIAALLSIPVSNGKGSQASWGWQAKAVIVVGVFVISIFAFAAAVAALEVLSRI